jgi:hypothetical protein
VLLSVQNIVADMRKVLAKNPQVEQQRLHRRIFLDNINPENQALLVSALSYKGMLIKIQLPSCFNYGSFFKFRYGPKLLAMSCIKMLILHV